MANFGPFAVTANVSFGSASSGVPHITNAVTQNVAFATAASGGPQFLAAVTQTVTFGTASAGGPQFTAAVALNVHVFAVVAGMVGNPGVAVPNLVYIFTGTIQNFQAAEADHSTTLYAALNSGYILAHMVPRFVNMAGEVVYHFSLQESAFNIA